GDLWRQLALIPREEIGYLVNLAVLSQSILFAALILALPWALFTFGSRRADTHGSFLFYFPALGLGFLFIEIYLIEKAAFLLGDQTLAFSLVLGGMLFFSGLGSWFSGRYEKVPAKGLPLALGLTLVWFALSWFGMDLLLGSLLSWGTMAKCACLLLL